MYDLREYIGKCKTLGGDPGLFAFSCIELPWKAPKPFSSVSTGFVMATYQH